MYNRDPSVVTNGEAILASFYIITYNMYVRGPDMTSCRNATLNQTLLLTYRKKGVFVFTISI